MITPFGSRVAQPDKQFVWLKHVPVERRLMTRFARSVVNCSGLRAYRLFKWRSGVPIEVNMGQSGLQRSRQSDTVQEVHEHY